MDVLVQGKKIRLSPTKAIGKGGEADVYAIGSGLALKVFKTPDHPDLAGDPGQQQAAGDRLKLHQEKLRKFPRGLPDRVLAPLDLAMTTDGRTIAGYTMSFLPDAEILARYSDRQFRQAGVAANSVLQIFRDLWHTVGKLHQHGIVIGDFNDLNVLVKQNQAWLIDTDSFQFGSFPCPVFTLKFLDPMLCQCAGPQVSQEKPFRAESDWYAFAVMLFEALLFVHPFSGVFRPTDPGDRILPELRPLRKISVYHSQVRYPSSALPMDTLPDELHSYFQDVFVQNRREPFPRDTLEALVWTTCGQCGREHARRSCPTCSPHIAEVVKASKTRRGSIAAETVFRTRGRVLACGCAGDKVQYLYHEDGRWLREDGSCLMNGELLPGMAFSLSDADSLVLRAGTGAHFAATQPPQRFSCDVVQGRPQAGLSGNRLFWIQNGFLHRGTQFGPEVMGEILAGQTQFRVGPRFGFGWYRAGFLSVAFVFDVRKRGINDTVAFPALPGQLVSFDCCFADDLCWFFTRTRDRGREIGMCTVIRSDGKVLASVSESASRIDWLEAVAGKVAVGKTLLSATSSGLVRLDLIADRIVETRRFPDAEPFVHEGCRLLLGGDSLFVAEEREIRRLRFSSTE